MLRVKWHLGVGLVLLGVLATGSCRDRKTFNTVLQALFPTRADDIALGVDASWHEPTGSSINPARVQYIPENSVRVFHSRDGAGLFAFRENGPGIDFFYMTYFGPTGAMGEPVRIKFDGDIVNGESLIVVWTPAGDAVIAFLAHQGADPAVPGDLASTRVYATMFHRSLAQTPIGPNGEEYGFTPWARPIDTNVPGTDDNDVAALFVATNLADGTLSGSADLEDRATGSAGDSSANLGAPFLFLFWVYPDSGGELRAEGAFADLDANSPTYLQPGTVMQIPTAPAIATDESLSLDVLTSGRDILLPWTQNNGSGSTQAKLNLVRVNAARDGLEPAIDITRGTATTGTTSTIAPIDPSCFMGDGFRPLNGQRATWVVFRQTGYVDGATVTNPDADVVVAKVDDAGQLSIDEFDHEPASSATGNDVFDDMTCCIGRGASRAMIYYRQIEDVSGATPADSISLFARAIYLTDSSVGNTFPNAVSDEVRVNTTVDNAPASAPNADVVAIWTPDCDPFCGPQCDNDVFHVAFRQHIEADGSHDALRYGRLRITLPADLSVPVGGRVGLAAQEETIEPMLDRLIGGTLAQVAVVEAGSAGGAVVLYFANGNNKDDRLAAGFFPEQRVLAWSNLMPGAPPAVSPALPPTEVSSTAGGLPGDWETVRDMTVIATPYRNADRDFALDTDSACVEFAHLVFAETDAGPGSETTLRGRSLDLRDGIASDPLNRFFPAPTSELFQVSAGKHARTGTEISDYLGLAPQGNDLAAVFPENTDTEGASDHLGQVFVNTFSAATRTWSRAALLSNESREPVFADEGDTWIVSTPGWKDGCPQAIGAWVFWTKVIAGESDEDVEFATYVQGRRITGLALPAR